MASSRASCSSIDLNGPSPAIAMRRLGTRRGGREGVQLRRIILLFHQASDTADDDIVGSKAELSSKLRHPLRGDAIDGPQVCAVGDHAKLVERHAAYRQNRRPSDGETATMNRIIDAASRFRTRCAARSGREWLRQEPADRSGTWHAKALRNPTAARMPIARAASPPYSIGRGL